MMKLLFALAALMATASLAEAALPPFPAFPKAAHDLDLSFDLEEIEGFYCGYAGVGSAPETWIKSKANLAAYRNEVKLARKACQKNGEGWVYVGLPAFPKDANLKQVVELAFLTRGLDALSQALPQDAPPSLGAYEGSQSLKDSMPDLYKQICDAYAKPNMVQDFGAVGSWVEAVRLSFLRTGN